MTREGIFANGEFYHIFSQGVDKRSIVIDFHDADRFMLGLVEFNTKEPIGSLYEHSFVKEEKNPNPLVKIICYCLNPNHFHLILEQIIDGGISELMRRLVGGYSRYFNIRHKRRGALFQGAFKVKLVSDNDYLLHLSSYVNLNNKVHGINDVRNLIRSSWNEYTRTNAMGICTKDIILEQFKNSSEYKEFCLNNLPFMLEKRLDYKELEGL